VCADPTFSGVVRRVVLKTMDEYQNVGFVETEFQPQHTQETRPQHQPPLAGLAQDIEMDTRSQGGMKALVLGSPEKFRDDHFRLMKSHTGVAAKLDIPKIANENNVSTKEFV
jgi:hypothetical protein